MKRYKVTLEVGVDDDVKTENRPESMDDVDYIESELGWLESSFASVSWGDIEEVGELGENTSEV